jgi:RNase adaptor protein for sRNA GlmZ degradation
MTAVLVTGMSGAGKSSALARLAARGHDTVDSDTDEWSEWTADRTDWIWRADAITALLTAPRDRPLFVAGCKTNQGRFYPLFDHVVLLTAAPAVLLARIESRTTNPYGKSAAERAEILANLRFEPRLRAGATVVIDAAAPLDEVVDRLEALTTGTAG